MTSSPRYDTWGLMTLVEMKARYVSERMQFVGMVGMVGRADGPTAKVWRVTNYGVWVTMPDRSGQIWHPKDIRVV